MEKEGGGGEKPGGPRAARRRSATRAPRSRGPKKFVRARARARAYIARAPAARRVVDNYPPPARCLAAARARARRGRRCADPPRRLRAPRSALCAAARRVPLTAWTWTAA